MKQHIPPVKSIEQASQPLTLKQALEVIQELRQRITELKTENQKLKAQLSKNSRNSSKPGCSCSMMYNLTSHTILAYFPPELLPSARSLQGSQA